MNEINRIQGNAYQVGGLGGKPENKAKQKEENKQPEAKSENRQFSAGDVLNYMSVQAASVKPKETPKVLDVSKYVSAEQAQRICGFISQFEDAVVKGLKEIENELGPNVLTEDAKMDLAIELFKAQNM